MIRLFISIYCIFLTDIAFSQQPYLEGTTPYLDYKTLGSMHLKGAVKQITETSYKATMVNGKFVKGAKGWQNTWDYDMMFIFDANGFLITQKELRSGSYQVKSTTKIDSLKRVVHTTFGARAHFYTYDSLGRISKSKETNSETAAVQNYLYYYDDYGYLSRKECFVNKKIKYIETFQYDKAGNCIAAFYKDEDYATTDLYTYNAANQLIEHSSYEFEDLEEMEKGFFEYKGQELTLEKWLTYLDSELINELTYRFENGNLVEITETDVDKPQPEKATASYAFDAQGNWIRQYINENGKLFIVERTIVYFP